RDVQCSLCQGGEDRTPPWLLSPSDSQLRIVPVPETQSDQEDVAGGRQLLRGGNGQLGVAFRPGQSLPAPITRSTPGGPASLYPDQAPAQAPTIPGAGRSWCWDSAHR